MCWWYECWSKHSTLDVRPLLLWCLWGFHLPARQWALFQLVEALVRFRLLYVPLQEGQPWNHGRCCVIWWRIPLSYNSEHGLSLLFSTKPYADTGGSTDSQDDTLGTRVSFTAFIVSGVRFSSMCWTLSFKSFSFCCCFSFLMSFNSWASASESRSTIIYFRVVDIKIKFSKWI